MHSEHAHPWDVTPKQAIAIQQELRAAVVTRDDLGPIERVAGVDVGFEARNTVTRAGVAVLDFPGLRVVDEAVARVATGFPYVPGLLSFREVPAILAAMQSLQHPPDLILCDAHGLAHPRRFGLACHLGLLVDTPAIGVAKTRLIGEHAPVPDERGAWTPLVDDGETIGAVLRSRKGTKPIYVSVGHRVSLETAVDRVMQCTPRYRLPETTRQAHRLASMEK